MTPPRSAKTVKPWAATLALIIVCDMADRFDMKLKKQEVKT
jgi:hypothetical protein